MNVLTFFPTGWDLRGEKRRYKKNLFFFWISEIANEADINEKYVDSNPKSTYISSVSSNKRGGGGKRELI